MADKIEGIEGLFDQLHSLAELGRRIGTEAEQLETRLRELGSSVPVAARGTRPIARQPVDQEIYYKVRKMLEAEPMRFAQLVEATGLAENKIKVLLTKMQREGVKIVNIGAANKALWYIPPPKVRERLERTSTESDR